MEGEGKRDFTPRRTFTVMKNGKMAAAYVQVNVKAWQAVGAALLTMFSLVGSVWASFKSLITPEVRKVAEEIVAPVDAKLDAHVAYDADTYIRKDDAGLIADRAELKRMSEQIEWLYRNEIRKAGR